MPLNLATGVYTPSETQVAFLLIVCAALTVFASLVLLSCVEK